MSFPRTIQTLIIEDQPGMVETYKGYYTLFKDTYDVAPPCIVSSYEEAIEELGKRKIYHIVILDLKLPNVVGGDDAEQGPARGLALLEGLTQRELFPIPVLLVITGDPARIVNFPSFNEQLQKFFYAQLIQKSPDFSDQIVQGLDQVLRYNDFGIVVTDDSELPRPSLTPREEDLLRRSGLNRMGHIGVDLRWWSSPKNDHGAGSELPQWVKVLQGRFLLHGQDGLSRPRFFKFESVENGRFAHASAERMSDKLLHIKVVDFQSDHARSLLVTEKAGYSGDSPISIHNFLSGNVVDPFEATKTIASDIAGQLKSFGDRRAENRPVNTLFASWLNADKLDTMWAKHYYAEEENSELSPGECVTNLKSLETSAWLPLRAPRHGDLHQGNVVLDMDAGTIRAYVIDGGFMNEAVCSRDIATLEVSLLLHQQYSGSRSLVSYCSEMYSNMGSEISRDLHPELPSLCRNTYALLANLRTEALAEVSNEIYSLLLLDEILIQIQGLSYGTSHNLIFQVLDAVELYRLCRDSVSQYYLN